MIKKKISPNTQYEIRKYLEYQWEEEKSINSEAEKKIIS